MFKLSSIDLGFLYTKGIVNNKSLIFKSVVGSGKELEFRDMDFSEDDGSDFIICNSKDSSQFVSDLAIAQSDSIIHSLKPKRFDSMAVRTLLTTAFALGFGNGAHSTHVVSGLPVSHYSKFKDDISLLFMGEDGKGQFHEYSVINGDQNISGVVSTVAGLFLPQPFGAFADEILGDDGSIIDKKLASGTTAIIDIGFGTTDVYVVNALSPIEKLIFSTTTAMNHAYSLIAGKIYEKFSTLPPFYIIEEVVKTSHYERAGKKYPMKGVIEWAYSTTSEQLVGEIHNKWKSSVHEVNNVIVPGGGGLALSPYLLPEFENSRLAKRGQLAVVNGYNKWGIRTWKDRL